MPTHPIPPNTCGAPNDVIGSAGSPCFPDKDGLWDALPTIRLTLQGGYQLTLHPINYISLVCAVGWDAVLLFIPMWCTRLNEMK